MKIISKYLKIILIMYKYKCTYNNAKKLHDFFKPLI